MAMVELQSFITRAACNITRVRKFSARFVAPLHRTSLLSHVWCAGEFKCFSSSVRQCNLTSITAACAPRDSADATDLLRTEFEEKCVLKNFSYTTLEEHDTEEYVKVSYGFVNQRKSSEDLKLRDGKQIIPTWVESIGYKKGQALMLWKYLYGSGKWAATVDEMTGLSKDFKLVLKEKADLAVLNVVKVHEAADGTRKIISAVDGGTIETVVIPFATGKGRTTVCVSSQVGCAMNCQFCYTGRMGLKRNLTTAEIVEQLVVACRLTADMGGVTNVVFMGMGEPLHNPENVIRAANIMVNEDGFHLSHNKVTISTSGLVPELRQFCRESRCSLAVSLNATTDEVRNWIMPINRKYNLQTLLGAIREEQTLRPNSHVLFEYVMLAGVNDSLEDAQRLVELVEGICCKVNLICFNPHSESVFRPSPLEQIHLFRQHVAASGLVVRIRRSRGDDQMAACGQLGSPGSQQPPRMRVPAQFQSAVTAY